jgi:hypothetical protein
MSEPVYEVAIIGAGPGGHRGGASVAPGRTFLTARKIRKISSGKERSASLYRRDCSLMDVSVVRNGRISASCANDAMSPPSSVCTAPRT